jgi:hypothetical protein
MKHRAKGVMRAETWKLCGRILGKPQNLLNPQHFQRKANGTSVAVGMCGITDVRLRTDENSPSYFFTPTVFLPAQAALLSAGI